MRTVATTRLVRWPGILLLLIIGLLGLHLPHYLAEAASPVDYVRYPGLVLVATMAAVAEDWVRWSVDENFESGLRRLIDSYDPHEFG